MKILLVCILLAFAVSSASASCLSGPAKSEPHTWSDKVMISCEYRGVKFMSGSKFTDVDKCMKCACTDTGFHCCGIGYYAGPRRRVAGCKVVPDQCDAAVLNSKKTALCQQY